MVFFFSLIFLIIVVFSVASHHKDVSYEKNDDENKKGVSSIKAETRQ
jgi:hypothetical protein